VIRPSLRTKLLVWLIVPLAVIFLINNRITSQASRHMANVAYDRTLQGAVLAIAEGVTVSGGKAQADIPTVALEMFDYQFQDRVYYRVRGPKGELLAGYGDIPDPPSRAERLRIDFYEAQYRDETVRFATLSRPLYDLGPGAAVEIVVGETLTSRQALAHEILRDAAVGQLWLIGIAMVLVAIGVHLGLKPLLRMREEILRREEGQLTPLPMEETPPELRPLVEALNHTMGRLERQREARRRFIADASHQLRTPLALIQTEAELARRQPDLPTMQDGVDRVLSGTRQAIRLANQLLSLSRAEPDYAAQLDFEPLDLADFARALTAEFAPAARKKRIDLGFEGETAWVRGNALLLHELLSNLIDNAIHYTPKGGVVTVAVTQEPGVVWLAVRDSGPGIPAAERARVFERFYRADPSRATRPGGSGLGLAIAAELVRAHGGEINLVPGTMGATFRITIPDGAVDLIARRTARARA